MVKTSHSQILRATSLLGGAGVANILISLIRNKFAAVLLGPSGLGLVGLMLSLIQSASALGGLGIPNAAVREVAAKQAGGSDEELAKVRWGVTLGTVLAATLSGVLLYLCRQPIADHVLEQPELGSMVGWMAPAVALSIITASQVALIAGSGKVSWVAGAGVVGAAISTALGVAVLLIWGDAAILPYILATPVGSWLAAHLFARRLARPRPTTISAAFEQSRWLMLMGAPMMLGTFVTYGSQFAVRAIVSVEGGIHEVGLFQAALALSTIYVGVLLQSIGSDFYPRLSGVIDDRETAVRLINEQTETLLMLAGLVVLGLLALAPFALRLLYADAFDDAATALRWLVLGNLVQIAAWPLGFCLLAAARSKLYLILEIGAAVVTIGSAKLLVPALGFEGAAIATLCGASAYLLAVGITTAWIRRSAWRTKTYVLFLALLGAAAGVFAAAQFDFWLGTLVGALLTLLWIALVYRELRFLIFPKRGVEPAS
ncbi:oligosaccharide flippase family protein [Sphingomonas sp. LHG3443-2]|uniref:oligosaccharide flippase family protein n=1 Tax=Sphingomonas sp. LHG3443-2 TaxID=2804639 RepID=UPI003CF1187C